MNRVPADTVSGLPFLPLFSQLKTEVADFLGRFGAAGTDDGSGPIPPAIQVRLDFDGPNGKAYSATSALFRACLWAKIDRRESVCKQGRLLLEGL